VKNIVLPSLSFWVLSCFTFAPGIFAQTGAKSPQNCDKLGPHTWKGDSIEERRDEESAYWGCRMGLPTATIKQWQQASDEPDPIRGIRILRMNEQELVFIERMGGTMRCRSLTALRKTSKGWERVWDEYGDEYCMVCPAIRIKILGSHLVLEVPKSTAPACEQLWRRKEFIWNGKTFRPADEHREDGKP
jgi:hypothetical protein